MPQLLIRDIDAETIKRLKLRALQHHRSLQGELKFIVETATKLSLEEASRVSAKWHKRLSGHAFSDSATLLREDRKR